MLLPPDERPQPLLKWPGGKRGELAALSRLLDDATAFHEPFVGGGAVWFATDPEVPAVVNDACADLVALYRLAREHRHVLDTEVRAWACWWGRMGGLTPLLKELQPTVSAGAPLPESAVAAVVDAVVEDLTPGLVDPTVVGKDVSRRLRDKARRIDRGQRRRGLELPAEDVVANLEAAARSVVYYRLRDVYNDMRREGDIAPVAAGARGPDVHEVRRVAAFWLLRELAYAAMFRFNAAGDFNVPYGGVSYNRRDLAGLADRLHDERVQARLSSTTLQVGDFATALREGEPAGSDLVFVDPPYAARFSTYDDADFTVDDHRRLADTLSRLPCRFVLVVSDAGDSERIYDRPGWRATALDKTWAWTIKQRNDRSARLLVVTNAPDVHERATA